MFLSPKTSRGNINYLLNGKSTNTNRNSSKDDNDNKYSKKKLSSRNNDIIKNPKKYIYKNIIPTNLIQFSSNNSTSSNTSHLNHVKTHKNLFNYYEEGYKNPDYKKRNMKYFKRQDYSNILLNNTKEKNDTVFDKYKKKTYNGKILNSNSNNNIRTRHNRSLSKNLNQDLVISKIVDKLSIDNISKINSFNLNLNLNQTKFDIEKTFLGSMTTKEFNISSKQHSQKIINFPLSTNNKNNVPANNINSMSISHRSAFTSSTGNIYSKKTTKQIKSSKAIRPNSNDNMKKIEKNNSTKSKKEKAMNVYKSKDISHNITFNNYCKKQKKYSHGLGLNNNKIEYVQINLFNNGHEDNKYSKEKKFIFNKIEKNGILNGGSSMKHLKKNKEKEVRLFDSEINGSNEGLFMTKSFVSFNDKSRLTKDISTPEENHFQAVNYLQLIKSNNQKFC